MDSQIENDKYKTRVYVYAGMTSDCTVGGLCEIFMSDECGIHDIFGTQQARKQTMFIC